MHLQREMLVKLTTGLYFEQERKKRIYLHARGRDPSLPFKSDYHCNVYSKSVFLQTEDKNCLSSVGEN